MRTYERPSLLAKTSVEEQEAMFNEMLAGAASPPLPPIDDDELEDLLPEDENEGEDDSQDDEDEGFEFEIIRGNIFDDDPDCNNGMYHSDADPGL